MIRVRSGYFLLALCAFCWVGSAQAAESYSFDIKGMHAFIQFKVKHLGYSYEIGRFNSFSGDFMFDEKDPKNNKVNVSIDVASLDTNHAERDKHLRGADFFDAETYPTATFKSSSYEVVDDSHGVLKGVLTLRGVSKNVNLDVHQIGAGSDPWGGFRRGFEGTTTLHLSDYHMKKGAMLGPVAEDIEIYVSVEGIRQ